MSLHHLATHMQSQGRDGDTGLIHMSPAEINGLQHLAIAHGGSLTINPTTGLPEASFMKDWLPSILGGLTMLIPGIGPFAAMALAAGTSFGTSMAVGNSFNKSLMAGLASGAGAGIGGALGGAGAAAAGEAGALTAKGVANVAAQGAKVVPTIAAEAGEITAANALKTGAQQAGKFGTTPQMFGTQAFKAQSLGGSGMAGPRIPQIASTEAMGTGMGRTPLAYQSVGKPLYQGAAAADYVPGSLSKTGSYAPVLESAPSQVQFTPELSNQAIFKAAGPMEKLSLMKQGAGAEFASPEAAGEFAWNNKGKLLALGTGVAGNMMPDQQPLRAPPPEKSDYAGPYKPVERTAQFQIGPQAYTDTSEFQYFNDVNPYPGVVPYKAAAGGLMGLAGGGSYDDEAGQDGYADGGEVGTRMATPDMDAIQNYVQSISRPQEQQMAMGGMTSLARGGSYLDGPGDGLSDSIHATIGNNQPARLADGEFVISADVVSDIGGGSSKAGAKKLHAMMDRVRQSAHGTKKQVKKINDRKVLAA